MMIKGIVFDLDGVICSTDEYHFLAWKKLADRLGVPFDREKNKRLLGISRMDSLKIVLEDSKGYSDEEMRAFADEKNRYYRELLGRMSPADLSEEVKDTLDELRRRKIRLAIGSSSMNAKYILKQIGLEGFFDAVSDGTNIKHSKPDPEVFLCAARYLGLDPRDCMVVEDAKAGIEAAAAGGFESAALGEAVKCKLADFNLDSFAELLEIV
ncbi:MAG: beta-phosphoglucomutase [Lachnospiraceae bacterium]|nr:beta-phosphoglucomutase [Lachnospiraceae bacterium]